MMWHAFFETLGYLVGGALYARQRTPEQAPQVSLTVVAGAVMGAALGARLLHGAQVFAYALEQPSPLLTMFGGKTIVGGLLGGTLGVELAKRIIGVTHRTGDRFVFPIAVGLMIGRIGCLVGGLSDHTFGNATSLPWGFDYGDGTLRHPTPIYEIVFLGLWLAFIGFAARFRRFATGQRYQLLLGGYCAFRFSVEFLKPPFGPLPVLDPPLPTESLYAHMTAIQWAAVAGVTYFAADFYRTSRTLTVSLPSAR